MIETTTFVHHFGRLCCQQWSRLRRRKNSLKWKKRDNLNHTWASSKKNFWGGGGVLLYDGSGYIHFCSTKQIYVFIYFLKIPCSCTFHGSTINRRKKADNDAIAISTKNRWWYSVGMYTESGFWGYGYLFILWLYHDWTKCHRQYITILVF